MAGSEQSQKMKNDTKSRVFVPELAGKLFGRLVYEGQMALIMSVTHSPPIQAYITSDISCSGVR